MGIGRSNAPAVRKGFTILTPKEWITQYEPTITASAGTTLTNPSNSASFRVTYNGSPSGGATLSWGNFANKRKAKVYWRGKSASTYGGHGFIYDGSQHEVIPPTPANTLYAGVAEIQDLSTFTSIYLTASSNNQNGYIEIFAIEVTN